MGFISRLVSFSFKLTLVGSLLLFGITLLPDYLFGEDFNPQPKHVYGSQLPSNLKIIEPTLDEIKKLDLAQEIGVGPESIKFHGKFIYTGNSVGQILKIDPQTKKVTVLTTMVDKEAKNCANNIVSKEACGRALDLEIVGNTLYAVDTYRGFIEYDLIKNTKTVYDLTTKIPGYESGDKVFNSIRQDPTNPNIIYISLSSTKYGYDKISFIFLEQEASGIVIAFNKATKKVSVIVKDLALGNGIEVTDDKKTLLVNDLCRQRIMKLDLKEVNAFIQKSSGPMPKLTVFKDRIPGYPDNLVSAKDNKHLFAALFFYIPDNDILLDQIFLNIYVRKFTHRMLYLGTTAVKFIKQYYNSSCGCMDKLLYALESGNLVMAMPYKSAIAILDQNTGDYISLIKLPIGKITHAIYNPSTSTLYLGSVIHKAIHTMSLKL